MASVGIRTLFRSSLRAALTLSGIKVVPIASYVIQIVWKYFSSTQLEKLDWVPTCAMGLRRSPLDKHAYLLGDTSLYVGNLVRRFKLPTTFDYSARIDSDLYDRKAFSKEAWIVANRTNQSAVVSVATFYVVRWVFTRQTPRALVGKVW